MTDNPLDRGRTAAREERRRCSSTTTPTTSAPASIKAFEKKYEAYNVKVTVSTFNDTDEALTKIRAGKVPFDIYFPEL